MKKQSSIEWFFEQLEFNDSVSRYELLEQAKQMHKQEVIESYGDGVKDGINYYIDSEWGNDTKLIGGEQYYKNTYEKTR